MKRVCVKCRCIIDQDWVKKCPQCGGKLKSHDHQEHKNYLEMDVEPDWK